MTFMDFFFFFGGPILAGLGVALAVGLAGIGSAKGVGIATTKAVVWSFVAIVILDLIFAAIFFY